MVPLKQSPLQKHKDTTSYGNSMCIHVYIKKYFQNHYPRSLQKGQENLFHHIPFKITGLLNNYSRLLCSWNTNTNFQTETPLPKGGRQVFLSSSFRTCLWLRTSFPSMIQDTESCLLRYHVALGPIQKEGPIWDSGFVQASSCRNSHHQKNEYE